MLHTIRSNYYKNCIENCNHDLKSMFGLCNKFLGRNIIRVLPDFPSVESFSNFFNTKIKNIISSLPYHSTSYSQIDIDDSLLFNSFNLPSIDNLIRLINSTKSVSIDDILPLSLLHKISIYYIWFICQFDFYWVLGPIIFFYFCYNWHISEY